MTPDARAALAAQLILHEGLRLKVYTDTLGIPTVGVGRNLRDKGITRDEALDLLSHDIDECVTDLATFAWFEALDAVRQRALVDLRFNIGPRRLRGFVKMLAALAVSDYGTAADELRDSVWATQIGATRRDTVLGMLRTGAV